MSGPLPIDRFIATTRTNRQDRVLAASYELAIERLRSMAEHFGLQVEVKVVYSSARRIEHITLAGKNWLIYDQYMGQSMNLLNRLFIEAEDGNPALVYFHKVLAERLVEVGRLNEALHCSKFYWNSKEVLSPKRVDELWRGLLTGIQERFLMYHEFGHRVFAEPKLMPVMREHVRSLIDHKLQVNGRSLEEEIADLREAPPAAYHHNDIDEAIRELREQHESGCAQQFTDAVSKALAEPQIEEEVFCDIFAADLISNEAYLDEFDHIRVLRAIYIGFYHLQALEYLRRFPSLPHGGVNWLDDNMPRVHARSYCLRAHLIFLLQLHQLKTNVDKDSAAEQVQAFEIQLMEDQKRHYEVIYDSATSLCDNLRADDWITKLGEEAVQILKGGLTPDSPSISDDELKSTILIMSGWLR